jgi:gliding motility-associated-like protein
MQYTLVATTAFGCSNRDAVAVKVIADIFVPTAFTPNNDGKNDRWQIAFHDPLLGATVKVYNRYGQLVYQAAGTATDWDGNVAGMQQASGGYVYVIQFIKEPYLKGTLLLIR